MSNNKLDIFHDFFRSNQHLLEKGDNSWSTERILYQLSYEHAEDSPITQQAEKYFNDGRITYPHFKKINRTKNLKLDSNFKTMTGHTGILAKIGVHPIDDNNALSWGSDGTLRLWDLKAGTSKVFEGHTKYVRGVHLMKNNQALSWSWDGTLRLWDLKAGTSKVFEGHTDWVIGVHLMENDQALSWSNDGTLLLLDLTNDIVTKYFFGGVNQVFLTDFLNRILCFNNLGRHRILELSDQFKID